MATLLRTSLTDHSPLDDTGDDINGAEVDENSYVLADVLDGTTQTDIASADRVDALSASTHGISREALRFINLDASAAAVQDVVRFEWDPASGNAINGQGIGLVWYAPDSVANQDEVASIDVVAVDVTSASEDYRIDFCVITAGTVAAEVSLTGANFYPAANDGNALGVSGTAWSDLFLASGAVINFNAGNYTLTHTAGVLTANGALTVAANSLTAGSLLANSNDVGAIGASGTAWSDLFLASGAVINFAAADVTITHSANTLAFAGASSGYTYDASVYINDTSNANMTTGLTINQGGSDNQILALKSSDVAHGLTSGSGISLETDDFFSIEKNVATAGGTRMMMVAENVANTAINSIWAFGGQATTDDTSNSNGLFQIYVAQHDGSNALSNAGNTDNIFSLHTRQAGAAGCRFLLKGNGDIHVTNTTLSALDDYPDALVMRAGRAAMAPKGSWLHEEFKELVDTYAPLLEERRIMFFERNDIGTVTGAMNNVIPSIMLSWDGLYQHEVRLQNIESKLALLAEKN